MLKDVERLLQRVKGLFPQQFIVESHDQSKNLRQRSKEFPTLTALNNTPAKKHINIHHLYSHIPYKNIK